MKSRRLNDAMDAAWEEIEDRIGPDDDQLGLWRLRERLEASVGDAADAADEVLIDRLPA